MKRIAIFGVLAAVLVLGFLVFNQEPAPTPVAEPVAEENAAVAPDVEATAEAPADDAEQPQMVEESAADEDEIQAEDQPIILAQAEVPTAPEEWKFSEDTHYARMVPTQPTVGGADKIAGALDADLQILDFAEIADQFAARFPGGFYHDVEGGRGGSH